jgi:hypothetical protein
MTILINGKDAFACDITDINQAWKVLQEAHRWAQQKIARNFYVGQRVSFDSRKRGIKIYGRITRVNIKSISLRAEGGYGNWKVSPDYLTPESEADVKRVRIA